MSKYNRLKAFKSSEVIAIANALRHVIGIIINRPSGDAKYDAERLEYLLKLSDEFNTEAAKRIKEM